MKAAKGDVLKRINAKKQKEVVDENTGSSQTRGMATAARRLSADAPLVVAAKMIQRSFRVVRETAHWKHIMEMTYHKRLLENLGHEGEGGICHDSIQAVIKKNRRRGSIIDENRAQHQGDHKMYTEENLIHRQNLRLNPRILKELERFWRCALVEFDFDHNGTLEKDEYKVMHRRLVNYVNAHQAEADAIKDDQAEDAFETDWELDAKVQCR
jgi:hypothetical protein